jgi:ABC-type enterochelin transport system substrate-binding protein
MSGQKRFKKSIANNKVVAMPSRKKEITIKDNNGNNVLDRNGEKVVENVQLYNIYKLK